MLLFPYRSTAGVLLVFLLVVTPMCARGQYISDMTRSLDIGMVQSYAVESFYRDRFGSGSSVGFLKLIDTLGEMPSGDSLRLTNDVFSNWGHSWQSLHLLSNIDRLDELKGALQADSLINKILLLGQMYIGADTLNSDSLQTRLFSDYLYQCIRIGRLDSAYRVLQRYSNWSQNRPDCAYCAWNFRLTAESLHGLFPFSYDPVTLSGNIRLSFQLSRKDSLEAWRSRYSVERLTLPLAKQLIADIRFISHSSYASDLVVFSSALRNIKSIEPMATSLLFAHISTLMNLPDYATLSHLVSLLLLSSDDDGVKTRLFILKENVHNLYFVRSLKNRIVRPQSIEPSVTFFWFLLYCSCALFIGTLVYSGYKRFVVGRSKGQQQIQFPS